MGHDCFTAIIGVIIPPIIVFQKKGIGMEFIIDLILWICTWALAVWYCFHLLGMDLPVNIFCLYIPPIGLYLSQKKFDQDFIICLVLWIFTWIGGAIWAYHKA